MALKSITEIIIKKVFKGERGRGATAPRPQLRPGQAHSRALSFPLCAFGPVGALAHYPQISGAVAAALRQWHLMINLPLIAHLQAHLCAGLIAF